MSKYNVVVWEHGTLKRFFDCEVEAQTANAAMDLATTKMINDVTSPSPSHASVTQIGQAATRAYEIFHFLTDGYGVPHPRHSGTATMWAGHDL